MKEKLEKRIAELIQRQDMLQAEFNSCNGAIAELRRLLIELEKPKENIPEELKVD